MPARIKKPDGYPLRLLQQPRELRRSGREGYIWEIDDKATIIKRIEDKTQDVFYIVERNNDGSWKRTGESIRFEYGTIRNDENRTYFSINQINDAATLFSFLAKNTTVEMGMINTKDLTSTIFSNNNNRSINMIREAWRLEKEGKTIVSFIHTHPNYTVPSGYSDARINGDRLVANIYEYSKWHPTQHYVYYPKYNFMIKFDKKMIHKEKIDYKSIFSKN